MATECHILFDTKDGDVICFTKIHRPTGKLYSANFICDSSMNVRKFKSVAEKAFTRRWKLIKEERKNKK